VRMVHEDWPKVPADLGQPGVGKFFAPEQHGVMFEKSP
jgi:hypothetical protein